MISIVSCKNCGKEYWATARGEYCCVKCRVAAHRKKKKAECNGEKAEQGRIGVED